MKKVYLFVAAVAFAACTIVSCSDTKKDGTAAEGAKSEEGTKEYVEHPTVDTPLEQIEVKTPEGDLNEKSHKQLLDSYEEFIDGYVVVLEKAGEGDTAAFRKVTDISRTVNAFAAQINQRRGQFSKEEKARYTKLVQKLGRASMSLHGRLKKTPK